MEDSFGFLTEYSNSVRNRLLLIFFFFRTVSGLRKTWVDNAKLNAFLLTASAVAQILLCHRLPLIPATAETS